ncbi:VWA domain-containing protein [Ornithinimicrobium cerasi]|uniref:von Willebrand factor type A domain-containing protein n=1 Tax=Ornithinimicrobium cerasi TaxID=2248773 RepID=A0A285VUR7_9MICO|nr:VWA domain-containing protein [Ornithinimicrobium cerasi]SOC57358.1 von Willebrand factor type A domain-containing protein [Ornithinimicrobium cerasi]
MAKHSTPSSAGWGRWLLLGLVVLLLAVAGVGANALLGRDDGGGDPGGGTSAPTATGSDTSSDDGAATSDVPVADDCTPVTVWSAPQLLPAVERAAERAGTDCFAYTVVSRETATAQSGLRGGDLPHVWLPSSSAWPTLVAEEGVELEVGETVASSPVMLAAVPEVVAGLGDLGITAGTTFAELTGIYQQLAATGDAPVRLRVGDPRVDAASMALLSTAGAQPGGWAEAGSDARGTVVLLAQTAVQGEPVSAIGSDPTTVVPATEQQIAAAAADGLELQGVPLAGGTGVVRMPFVRVGESGSPGAVDALEQELVSEAAASDLAELALRAGTDGPAPGVAGVPEAVGTDVPDVEEQVVALTAGTWTVIAPQSRILTLIDISGSMEAEIGDTTRIDLTRTAAQTALSVIPDQTAIGLWYFATALDGENDHVEEVALRALNEEVRSGVTQKDVLLAETENLGLDTLTGDTGLHDSLWAAYQYMQGQQSPESISSVLLLTDGINDDSTGGLSEDEVVQLLSEAREGNPSPVTVVLIGMGPDVDEEALDRLATAAGGESFVLRDPRELPRVFVDVVARRAP